MRKLWTDLHSNIHHHQMDDLDKWIEHIKGVTDFWPIAYYPFRMTRNTQGVPVEDLCPEEDIQRGWECIRAKVKEVNRQGFPMFMGYEWQGNGKDGDHNVFFLGNEERMHHPMRYAQLREIYAQTQAIAIPHHVAYQLGSRGKNWETHDEEFSPFAEIYSSHGCSENDTGAMDMLRHLHMGPRTGETCYERGLEKGLHVGCIASGDNHQVPAMCDHGSMCVLAEDNSKEAIWEGLKAGRVYGVSRTRMDIDFSIGGHTMGSVIPAGRHKLRLKVRAADAIDRVEILKNNILDEMVVHSGTWERGDLASQPVLRLKFSAEFGWGPNPKFYKNMDCKHWHGSLEVDGKLCSVEKLWNSFGQRLYELTGRGCRFDLTSYMTTATGHWMGPSGVVKEGFVFEVEGSPEALLTLHVDRHTYQFKLRELMQTSRILAQYQESLELAKRVYGGYEHYRDDLIWHNAYKIRLRQAAPVQAYTLDFEKDVEMQPTDQYRIRVWLKNGDAAWVSPVFAV